MRIAREIVDTLKIELGFLKFKSVELDITNNVSSTEIALNISFNGFGEFDCSIQGFNMNSEVIVNHSPLDDLSLVINDFPCYDIALANVDDIPLNFECSDLVREERLDVEFNVDVWNFETIIDEFLIIKNVEILKVNLDTFAINIDENSTKILSFKEISIKKDIITDKFVPSFVFASAFLPSKYVQKEKLYEVLRRLRTQYDINLIRFFGYYERIPLEMVKQMKVLSNHSLMIEFDTSKRMLNRHILKDIIVFRYDDKYIYQVV